MPLLIIKPSVTLRYDQVINIMTIIAKEISEKTKSTLFIINEDNYINLLNSIFNIIKNKLNIYKFYQNNITNIKIEIYNQDINVVLYMYFTIFSYYFNFTSSYWNNFIIGNYNTNIPIVYEALDFNQQQKIINAIASDEFFFTNDIIINININENVNANGILIKNNLCSCIKSTCQPTVLIVSIYWF